MSVVSTANWVPFPKRKPGGGCHQATRSLRKRVGSANLPSFPMMTFVEDYTLSELEKRKTKKKTMCSCKCIQTIYMKKNMDPNLNKGNKLAVAVEPETSVVGNIGRVAQLDLTRAIAVRPL